MDGLMVISFLILDGLIISFGFISQVALFFLVCNIARRTKIIEHRSPHDQLA